MIRTQATCLVFRQGGRGAWLYSAWERTTISEGKYHLVRLFAGHPGWWGRLGASKLPAEILSMPPGSRIREAYIADYRRREYLRAYEAISDAFPEAAEGLCSGGFVSLACRAAT